jgi:hypothetical protein
MGLPLFVLWNEWKLWPPASGFKNWKCS